MRCDICGFEHPGLPDDVHVWHSTPVEHFVDEVLTREQEHAVHHYLAVKHGVKCPDCG